MVLFTLYSPTFERRSLVVEILRVHTVRKIAWFTGELGGRGVTVVVEQAAKAVSLQAGYEVHVVCVHRVGASYQPVAGVSVHNLELDPLDVEACCRGAYQWIESEQPTVVLFNDTPAIEPLWPYVPSTVRSIGVLHDIAYGWRRPFIDYKASLDGVATVSPYVMAALEKDYRDYDGVLRIIDNGTGYPETVERRLNNRPLRLVFFGALDRQKGAYDLPKILKECVRAGIQCSLTVIGGLDDKLKAQVLSVAGDREVKWLGRLPRQECFGQLAEGDVFLALSRGESFGLTTVEAMAMGCVPVGYADGATQDIIETDVSGFLGATCDYSGLVKSIKKLDKDRELLIQMSYAASERARTVYTLEAMGERYLHLIDSVLAAEGHTTRRDYTSFALPKQKHRLYATYVPAPIRGVISRLLAVSPNLEKFLRKYKGV